MASGFPQSGLPGTEYASIGARIGAYIIDHLVVTVGVLPGLILYLIGTFGLVATSSNSSDGPGAAGGIAIVVIFLGFALMAIGGLAVALYNINKLGKTGQTIGKKVMKIKVVTPTGEPLGFGKAFLRELVKGLAGSFCFILLLWPMWDAEKQSLGDKVAGTHVYPA
jgi:uncharacterized RDD family membrane protein YckC